MTPAKKRRSIERASAQRRIAIGDGGGARRASGDPVDGGTVRDVPGQSDARRRVTPDWRWRSFPVFAALVAGVLIDSLISPPTNSGGQVLRIVALLGFGYVLAHLFVTNVIIAGRLKRRRKIIERGETPEEDFVEEAIYQDEAHGREPDTSGD